MDENIRYEQFLRTRITKLREQRNISEHRLSLGLTEQWEKARKPLKILGKTGVMR